MANKYPKILTLAPMLLAGASTGLNSDISHLSDLMGMPTDLIKSGLSMFDHSMQMTAARMISSLFKTDLLLNNELNELDDAINDATKKAYWRTLWDIEDICIDKLPSGKREIESFFKELHKEASGSEEKAKELANDWEKLKSELTEVGQLDTIDNAQRDFVNKLRELGIEELFWLNFLALLNKNYSTALALSKNLNAEKKVTLELLLNINKGIAELLDGLKETLKIINDYHNKEKDQGLSHNEREEYKRRRALMESIRRNSEAKDFLKIVLVTKQQRFEEVTNTIRKQMEKSIARTAAYFFQMGVACSIATKYEDAKEWLIKALRLQPQNTSYLKEIAIVCQELGEYKRAIYYFKKSLSTGLEGNEQLKNEAGCYNHIGNSYQMLREYLKAISYYQRALPILNGTDGDMQHYIANINNNIGAAWGAQGNHLRAIEYFGVALNIYLKRYGEMDNTVAGTYGNLGYGQYELGNYPISKIHAEKALEILKRIPNPDSVTIDSCMKLMEKLKPFL